MKIFLDDERQTPDGWVRCYWPKDVIKHLMTGECTHLSLDHDLGDDSIGTGYDVLMWLEEQVFISRTFPIPEITIHSSNASAAQRMRAAVESIKRLKSRKNSSDKIKHV